MSHVRFAHEALQHICTKSNVYPPLASDFAMQVRRADAAGNRALGQGCFKEKRTQELNDFIKWCHSHSEIDDVGFAISVDGASRGNPGPTPGDSAQGSSRTGPFCPSSIFATFSKHLANIVFRELDDFFDSLEAGVARSSKTPRRSSRTRASGTTARTACSSTSSSCSGIRSAAGLAPPTGRSVRSEIATSWQMEQNFRRLLVEAFTTPQTVFKS